MGFFDSLRTLFGNQKQPVARQSPDQSLRQSQRQSPPPPPEPEAEIVVPEVSPAELQTQVEGKSCPLLLDVREQHEWNQVRIPESAERTVLHIPMNDVPNRLAEIPKDKEIVVFCAHGSRSYGVTAWLNEQGYNARNLAGGITQWNRQGGTVQTGKASGGGAGGWQ